MTKFNLTRVDNIPNDYSIKQGEYYSFVIYYPEIDLREWILAAQIRRTYQDSNILESFNFEATTYGTREGKEGNWSTIKIYLNASQTSRLPVTKSRGSRTEVVKEGSNVWVYDVEAKSPTNEEKVIKIIEKSWIEVVGEVTR